MPRNILTLLISLCTIAVFAQQVKYDEWQNLTTSGKLPAQCQIQHSNNNLDLVRYHNKYYLA
ncbi:MAG TPA: hypothetical protein VK174_15170, partial [Chitinophagales bacterium]|nr:hypothetical protein [Chitinophagales bacterium]